MAKSHSCGNSVLVRLKSDYYHNSASNILLVNVLICAIGSFLVLNKIFLLLMISKGLDIRNMNDIVLYA